jgi:hypothetical protein
MGDRPYEFPFILILDSRLLSQGWARDGPGIGDRYTSVYLPKLSRKAESVRMSINITRAIAQP